MEFDEHLAHWGINIADMRKVNSSRIPAAAPLRPRATPFLEGKSILGVIYGVLLWADTITATPLGAALHSSGPNTSERWRRGYAVVYGAAGRVEYDSEERDLQKTGYCYQPWYNKLAAAVKAATGATGASCMVDVTLCKEAGAAGTISKKLQGGCDPLQGMVEEAGAAGTTPNATPLLLAGAAVTNPKKRDHSHVYGAFVL